MGVHQTAKLNTHLLETNVGFTLKIDDICYEYVTNEVKIIDVRGKRLDAKGNIRLVCVYKKTIGILPRKSQGHTLLVFVLLKEESTDSFDDFFEKNLSTFG